MRHEMGFRVVDYYHLKSDEVFLVSQKALIAQENRLLILRASDDTNLWELPGGLLEMDEEMQTGLIREVAEETGMIPMRDAWYDPRLEISQNVT